MALTIEFGQARQLIKKVLSRGRKRHNRTHDEVYDMYTQLLRALNLPQGCGECVFSKFEKIYLDGKKDRVRLRCDNGFSPLDQARRTPFLSEKFVCPGFSPKVEKVA